MLGGGSPSAGPRPCIVDAEESSESACEPGSRAEPTRAGATRSRRAAAASEVREGAIVGRRVGVARPKEGGAHALELGVRGGHRERGAAKGRPQ